ncbi:SDR family NAD(P)-dependent oxidoreductase [Acrocarpospora catenulata]|uniref:SDR family NAD(P)-dependent oxidoreductase n=1 Tax=Acrocarpospora catenulata TaxID=2836182 RepID=UPI001BDAFAF2|nr:SDR family NAD(P)-dependent oxidoreductase [Acrocarpospora catenulata]
MLWDPLHLPDLQGRTYAVTGSTAGIGYFAAEQLAAAGAHVVLVARNPAKLAKARASLAAYAPKGSSSEVVADLADLAAVRRGAEELAALPRLDGILLNGGSMDRRSTASTTDGHPVLLGTHVLASMALIAGVLPALATTGTHAVPARIVHTSTGFVRMFPQRVDDLTGTSREWVFTYTKAKTLVEIVAYELDRRLRENGMPVLSLLSRPGVGVDGRTPCRAGVHDETTAQRRHLLAPWAQGKDTAAWSAVRALVDPGAHGGDYFTPSGSFRGAPVLEQKRAPSTSLSAAETTRVWDELSRLAGVRMPV